MEGALAGAIVAAIVTLAVCWVWTRSQRSKIEQWHATLAGMPDGLMVVDRQLRLVEWNRHFAGSVGVPEQALYVGMPLADILRLQAQAGEFGPVDVEAEVRRRLDRFMAGIAVGTVERRRPNGRIMELRRKQMPNGGFVTLYTDITEKRGVEEQLRQAQKMEAIGRLTSGLAHDFNNLLAVIIGNLELAESALEASRLLRAQRKLEDAMTGARRAAAQTQRLLAFSRRQILSPQALDANQVIGSMSSLIRHSLGEIELETIYGADLWTTFADPHQLENALLNLAINARDAMPHGGKVTIETANSYLDESYAAAHEEVAPGQYVLIAVTDRGIGMSAEDAARAFEPFFTTKGVGKGSGLGLSQVFGFVKQSNGHVKIYSELGHGTAVKIYLPRVQEAAAGAVTETMEPAPVPAATGRETVLVVEDDADVLHYTTDALETLGYHVISAGEAAAALRIVTGRADVVLMLADVELPGTSGPDLAREVMRRRPGLPVLYMTGYPVNDMLDRRLTEPGARIITKPFALSDLARAVRNAIDGA
ncbi:MAG TPA: PAS-domain containing protein [Rhodopila sp.]|nr:PAS-domain containing protein [Rhodopila sp.]